MTGWCGSLSGRGIALWLAAVSCIASGCGGDSGPTVTVYASQDQVYAEPILQEFTRATGIGVQALYDSEAVKTVGLIHRLVAERGNPQCDVFWNNEELRTRQLEALGLLRRTNAWAPIGYRSRRLVINTNLVKAGEAPGSWMEITNARWAGRVALAYPLFGTTGAHMLALRQRWGEPGWLDWCKQLAANRPKLVDGNSVVVQLVARGEAALGLTDSDDISAAQKGGMPVAALPAGVETLFIPNTVGVMAGAPHPEAAERLFNYLQTPGVAQKLVAAAALEQAAREARPGEGLQPEWSAMLKELDSAMTDLEKLFLR